MIHNSILLIRYIRCHSKLKKLSSYRSCIYASRRHYCNEQPPIYDIPIENIRNFSIIAHVDHGKSTLADRLLEMTGAIQRNTGKQVLDKLQVEKERGITVKAQTASLNYTHNGKQYLLNLIDTPGHVDFCAEVHRSLAPCQGVILVVDANDGVQAQTVANYYLAAEKNLVIIPVINKIDLKNANPERVVDELNTIFKIEPSTVLKISAKLGTGCDDVLKAVVDRIPPPPVDREKPLRALIFDSWFQLHKGAISLIYVKEGSLSVKDQISFIHTKKSFEVKSLALLRPEEENVTKLFAGQVGILCCNMRTSKDSYIGDTVHLKNVPAEPLFGFTEPKPMVFAGIFPVDQSQFNDLRTAIEKLTLNDNAVSVTPDSSPALGQGWRLGFLGLLHIEVFIQRLEQEYGAEPIVTTPTVPYHVIVKGAKQIKMYKGDTVIVNNPAHFPDEINIKEIYEPMVIGTIITPKTYIGEVMKLCTEKRGVKQESMFIDNNRELLKFLLPLNEIIHDFHDSLKRISSGYASFDYEDCGFQESDIVKLNIYFNGDLVEEFSCLVHRSNATETGKKLCHKLAETIPRQLFLIVIQAKILSKVVGRSEIRPMKKDVTAKLYGGDITRKKKLLAQQAEGKRKMRMVGKVSVSRETFINVLKK